jgi:hypothetical protein
MKIDYSKIIKIATETKSADFDKLDVDLTDEQIEYYEYVEDLIKPIIVSSVVAAIEEYDHQVNSDND